MKNPVRICELKNGLTLYVQPKPTAEYLVRLFVKSGGMSAPKKLTGLPHVVEHSIRKNFQNYKKENFSKRNFRKTSNIDEFAASICAYSTSFGSYELYRRALMLESLKITTDFITNPNFTEENLASEKSAILNETHELGKDVPLYESLDKLYKLIYKYNPAKKRIDSEPKELKLITLSDVINFYNKHYVTKNMGIVLIGPSFDEAKRLTEEFTQDFISSRRAPKIYCPETEHFPKVDEAEHSFASRSLSQYRVSFGIPVEPHTSEDKFAIEILCDILREKLFDSLRNNNLIYGQGVYDAGLNLDRSGIHGIINISYATLSREFAKKSIEIVKAEFQKLRENLSHKHKFEDTKNDSLRYYRTIFGYDTPNLTELIIEAACCGDEYLESLHSYRDQIKKITRGKLREVANKYLTDNHMRVIFYPSRRKPW